MLTNDKIKLLRNEMKKNNIDAYIIPSSDAHQSEYVADYFKSRAWISGFSGSAGTVVITADGKNGLWTDGRYFIQAARQIEDSMIDLFKMREPGVPTVEEWLVETLEDGATIGFDSNVFSHSQVKAMTSLFRQKNFKINGDYDLIDGIWEDRPELPKDKVFVLDVKYAGKSAKEKLSEVRAEMNKKSANYYVISSLDDIAWLYNIRGNDVACNPVVISHALVAEDTSYLFVDMDKVDEEVKGYLEAQGVMVKPYEDVTKVLSELNDGSTVMLDPLRVSEALFNAIPDSCSVVNVKEVTTHLKALKNEVEIKNLKDCYAKDGAAMVKFLYWLDKNVGKQKVTEISASDRLEQFRRDIDLFVELSFPTISAYADHAPMMHYSATKESDYELKPEGFLLVDSGGQYYNGTTDITRTIALGNLTDEMKTDFTLTLKGHIALSRAKFLKGVSGKYVDILCRRPLWEHGIDYKCGTGHGVGFFLNVHEGPQRLAPYGSDVVLEEGMVVTNEPGVYKEGKHGIRTENVLIVKEDEKTDSGQFLSFDVLSYCPIDLDAVKVELLDNVEKKWLNDYHKKVYETVSPYITDDEKIWLKHETRAI